MISMQGRITNATPVFAILTLSAMPLSVFCHFVPTYILAEGFLAKMAISGKARFLLLPIINEL
jgi:hypothetical protein